MLRIVLTLTFVLSVGVFPLTASPSHPSMKLRHSSSIPKAQKVLVIKSKRKLYLIRNGTIYRSYSIALGRNSVGPKEREGDGKTPEGNYTLDFKKADSAYYRAIHVSYPTAAQRAAAKRKGIDPGGAIMIHGQPNWFGWLAFIRQRFDWTAGCIAVTNGAMDEIWAAVDPGTPIEIRP
ncbi:L,D-transpeptidase family protein [Nitratifractor sp.]